MARRRRLEGLSLTFLDVMACGLGASILLFLIIKHNTDPEAVSTVREEQALAAEIADLDERADGLRTRLDELVRLAGEQERGEEGVRARLEGEDDEIARLSREIAREEARRALLEEERETLEAESAADVVEDPVPREEQYLLGLRVEGRRIAILLDRSASMTDERLIEIIKRKVRPDAEKAKGPKWRRTVKVASWLLSRVPAESDVAVVAYGDEAEILGNRSWLTAKSQHGLGVLAGEVAALVPTGGTNLQAALVALNTLSPQATDVYVVTDGLPTKALAGVHSRTRCRAAAPTVSGECRSKIYWETLSQSLTSGARTNVILLPVEGDPGAAQHYYEWTSGTGGLTLTPAPSWP